MFRIQFLRQKKRFFYPSLSLGKKKLLNYYCQLEIDHVTQLKKETCQNTCGGHYEPSLGKLRWPAFFMTVYPTVHLKVLNVTKLVLNEHEWPPLSFRINFVSRRTFRRPLFPKPVSWLEYFLPFLTARRL